MHSFGRRSLVFFLFALLLPCCAVARPDFDALKKSVVRIVTQKSQGFGTGTGFAINDQGYIATNFHVIDDAKPIKVIPAYSSKRYDVEVVAISREQDLAIVYSPDITLPPITLSLAPLTIGQEVWSMGYPGGADRNRLADDSTVQKGIIGRIFDDVWNERRGTKKFTIIHHSAAINPGNSGGPLLDGYGRAIGVNTQGSLVSVPTVSGEEERVIREASMYWASHIGELANLLDDRNIDFQSEGGDWGVALVGLLLLGGVLVVLALFMFLKKPRQLAQQVSRRIGVRAGAKIPKYGLVLAGSDGRGNHIRIQLPLARFDAQGLGLSLGRHPNLVDEVVADETVSRRHLRIVAKGDKFYVEDLHSLNGTFLNRRRLKKPFEPMELDDGDEVALGDLVLVASYVDRKE